MSTKKSTHSKYLNDSFAVFFNLACLTPQGTERILRCKLAISKLSVAEQKAVEEDIDAIGEAFFRALAPALKINVSELANAERRPIEDCPNED